MQESSSSLPSSDFAVQALQRWGAPRSLSLTVVVVVAIEKAQTLRSLEKREIHSSFAVRLSAEST